MKRTYVEIKFINRTGTLLTIGRNLRSDWSDLKKIEYVRQQYLRYNLADYETLESWRFWSIHDTGAFKHAE